MNCITITGRIGKDAVLRATQKGDFVTGFSVGSDVGFGENKLTLWFDCSVWGKRAESLAPLLLKGTPITVIGELSTREHEGKTYLQARVYEIALQGGKKEAAPEASGWDKPQAEKQADPLDPFSDDIPF